MTLKRASITIKAELLQTVDASAHAEQVNRSTYISKALEAFTSGEMTADMTPSYRRDANRVVLLEHDVAHKEELLRERDRLIDLYAAILGGRASQLPRVEPVKVGFWRRVFGRTK
jgi:hypothetical protein